MCFFHKNKSCRKNAEAVANRINRRRTPCTKRHLENDVSLYQNSCCNACCDEKEESCSRQRDSRDSFSVGEVGDSYFEAENCN